MINLGGACAAPLPKKANPEVDDALSNFSMITENQSQPSVKPVKNQAQRTSVDLLSDLDLSAGTTQSTVDEQLYFPIDFPNRPSNISSTSPKLAYSHPSRQSGEYSII